MAIYIPAVYTEELVYDLTHYTQMTTAEARDFVDDLAWTIIAAATEALDQANDYTNAMTGEVRTDLTDSLNVASDILSDQIHDVQEYISDTMIPALDAIIEASGGISDEIGEEIINAYNSIADSHVIVGDVVELAIAGTADFVTESYTTVGNWIHEQFDGALAAVNSTIDHILKIPKLLVDLAVDTLIPAEQQAMFQTIGDILIGDPVRMLFDYGGKVFKAQLGEVLTIDDDELQKWIKTGSEYMQGIAMQAAKPEGAV